MGHLPIVNQDTVTDVIQTGFISTRGDLNVIWEKTTADIFSDMLATREGDLVFPWIITGGGKPNLGFKYVFYVDGPPIFVKGEEYPVKVPLKREGLEFRNPLSEVAALDLWGSKLLWNAIGKKSLGRGRSLTHQMPMEDDRLMDLLASINPEGPRKIAIGKASIKGVPITISTSRNSWDHNLLKLLENSSPYERLSKLDLDGIPWRSDVLFNYEKALEAWIMENIDKPPGREFRENVFEPRLKIEWFGNYLSFGVAGSNMDVVVIQSDDSRKLVTVIELKVSPLRISEFLDAANQVQMYCEFIKDAFKAYGESIETRGAVVSGISRISSSELSKIKDSNVKWIIYYIDDDGKVNFKHFLL